MKGCLLKNKNVISSQDSSEDDAFHSAQEIQIALEWAPFYMYLCVVGIYNILIVTKLPYCPIPTLPNKYLFLLSMIY